MQVEDSPFPCRECLPPLPFEMRGDFEWLVQSPVHDDHIGSERADQNARAIVALRQQSQRLGVRLPMQFVTFMETPSLQHRIRSHTLCFLNLCSALIWSPLAQGYLIRFLADSQGCAFWYLYLTKHGSDHAVVVSDGFYGTEDELQPGEKPNPANIIFEAESFEAFLFRFWTENETWYARFTKSPLREG